MPCGIGDRSTRHKIPISSLFLRTNSLISLYASAKRFLPVFGSLLLRSKRSRKIQAFHSLDFMSDCFLEQGLLLKGNCLSGFNHSFWFAGLFRIVSNYLFPSIFSFSALYPYKLLLSNKTICLPCHPTQNSKKEKQPGRTLRLQKT